MTILITGASGLIGRRLTRLLSEAGHVIHALGRSGPDHGQDGVRYFRWDPENRWIDPRSIEGADAIVHLAGAGVAEKRWTAARKKEIVDSRIGTTRLLYDTLSHTPHQIKTIISASAVGYYGDRGHEVLTEDSTPSSSFLGELTSSCEKEVLRFEELGIRHVCCRIGIVLSESGGALPELARPLQMGLAAYFSKTPLYYPWIHIDDVCGIMRYALENHDLRGSYNTTAPAPSGIRELVSAIAKAKNTMAIPAPVPAFVLRMVMGEMADMLLSSQNCNSQKIQQAGYEFRFPDLEKALEDIYRL